MTLVVSVHEAVVADPKAACDHVLILILKLEGVFKSIVIFILLVGLFDEIRWLL